MEENSSYLSLIYAFFNQYLFNEAKTNIRDIKYYFDTNPATAGNPLVECLLGAIKDYDFSSMTLPLFQGILMKTGKTQAEGKQILDEIVKYKMMDKNAIEPAKKYLKDIIATVYLRRAEKLYSTSPSDYIKYIKDINFKSTNEDYMAPITFNKLDINSIIAMESTKGIKSYFDWVNNAYQPECCYPNHGLVLLSMPPGSGKSCFAMLECLNFLKQGFRVCYVCLGDMTYKDFIIRMAAMCTGLPYFEIKKDIKQAYETLEKVIEDRLELIVAPSSTISVDELIDHIKTKGDKTDVLMIDYDSNLKTTVMTDSMYLVYREIYARLSELTIDHNKLVFILSQPQKNSWQNPIIEQNEIGESAGKVHAADLIITRGKEPGNLNGLGTFKIVKNRSGDENVIDYSILLKNGRFKSLPKAIFEDIKQVQDKKMFSETEIDTMVSMYLQSRSNFNKEITQKINNSSGGHDIRGFKPF